MEQGIAAVEQQRAQIVGTSLTACKAPPLSRGQARLSRGQARLSRGQARLSRGLRDFAGLASLPDYFEQQYARGDGHIQAFNPTEHWDADQLIAQAAGQTP